MAESADGLWGSGSFTETPILAAGAGETPVLSAQKQATFVPAPAAPSLGKSLPPPGAPRPVWFLSLGSRRILEACEISPEGRGAGCGAPWAGPPRPRQAADTGWGRPARAGAQRRGCPGRPGQGRGRRLRGRSHGGHGRSCGGPSAQSGLRSVPHAPGRWVRDACFARRPAGSCASGAAGSAGFFDGRKAPGARTEPPPHFAHGKAGLRGASAGAALKPLETCPWLSRRDSSSDEDSKPCGAKRASGGPRPARPCAVSARRTHGDGRAGPRPGGRRRGRGPGRHSQAGGPRGEDALSSRTLRGPRRLARGRPSAALSRSQFRSPTADRGLDTCDGTFQK